jgi:hypothetical protein
MQGNKVNLKKLFLKNKVEEKKNRTLFSMFAVRTNI